MKRFHTVTTDCESFVGTKDTILRRLKTVTLVCIGFDYICGKLKQEKCTCGYFQRVNCILLHYI